MGDDAAAAEGDVYADWRLLLTRETAVLYLPCDNSVLELSRGSNGWFRFSEDIGTGREHVVYSWGGLNDQRMAARDQLQQCQHQRETLPRLPIEGVACGSWSLHWHDETATLSIRNKARPDDDLFLLVDGFLKVTPKWALIVRGGKYEQLSPDQAWSVLQDMPTKGAGKLM
eukprot:m.41581 g.41581  ORF g.41581 m.41581 type:complete len:171 (+) comp11471_c0_seq2:109-621(+)